MKDTNKHLPYKDFGVALRAYRVAANSSLEDVSSAVELDPERLEKFERGETLPSSDTLIHLINHLSLRDRDATRLWELSGYDQPSDEETITDSPKTRSLLLPDDLTKLTIQVVDPAQVVFTDAVQVVSNDFGVILNFAQQTDGDLRIVSRLGMSKEHAQRVLKALQEALDADKDSKQG